LTSAQLPEQRRRAALRVARLENAPDDLCERVTCAAPIAPIRDYSLRLMFKKERKEGEKKWGGKKRRKTAESARGFSSAGTRKVQSPRQIN